MYGMMQNTTLAFILFYGRNDKQANCEMASFFSEWFTLSCWLSDFCLWDQDLLLANITVIFFIITLNGTFGIFGLKMLSVYIRPKRMVGLILILLDRRCGWSKISPVGNIRTVALVFADDAVLLASSVCGLGTLIITDPVLTDGLQGNRQHYTQEKGMSAKPTATAHWPWMSQDMDG